MDRSRESAGLPNRDFHAVDDMNCKMDMIRVSRLFYYDLCIVIFS